MTSPTKSLFCFGVGFSARHVIQRLDRNVWHIAGTSTSPDGASALTRDGIESYVFDGSTAVPGVAAPPRLENVEPDREFVLVPARSARMPPIRGSATRDSTK